MKQFLVYVHLTCTRETPTFACFIRVMTMCQNTWPSAEVTAVLKVVNHPNNIWSEADVKLH